jgi:hypothetical protein
VNEERGHDSRNPFREIADRLTKEKANAMARRHREYQVRRMPLLAASGLLEEYTTEQIIAAAERKAEEWDQTVRRMIRFARLARFFVSRRVALHELNRLDERRLKLPKSPAYSADFWRRVLGDLCGRDEVYRKR